MSRIELRSDGRRILVPIKVLKAEAHDLTAVDAIALLDTGATTSGISAEIAERLDLAAMGKRPMGSARGLDFVERYLFRIGFEFLDVYGKPSFPFVFAPILGFEIVRGSSFEALIGMDLIHQCDLTLSRNGTGTLTL